MYNLQQSKAFHRQIKMAQHYVTTRRSGVPMRLGPFEWIRALCFHTRIIWSYYVARNMIKRGVFDADGYANRSWKSLYVTEALGGRIEVEGLEHLAKTPGPVVIIGNHMASLETVVLPCFILPFKEVAFVVKQSLRTHFAFGPIMCAVKHIAVSRDNPREDLKRVLNEGTELIRQGVTVVIFPQATRSAEFDVDGFNTLGVKLAARAGVPVIPLALKTDFMANGKWVKDAGYVYPERPIRFAFGAPLAVTGNGRETHAAVVDFIVTHLKAWGGSIKGTAT
ncbi:MAG: lysophospholipid acyltransferase family protein [bacterium]|jgi:1-acyl-sn-glycerol-3-phosphate acyltransferase